MREAKYDLGFHITGHDFFSWLVVAVARGAERVVFKIDDPKTSKWEKKAVLERFESIVKPGPALAGVDCRIGDGGESNLASPHMMDLVKFCETNKFTKLRTVEQPWDVKYTVTIRNEPRIRAMNSNQPAWRKFAEQIGAVVIEDYYDSPMDLHQKVALYAGAKMNFGVVNGPMHLLTLTDYPVAIFKANVSASNLNKHGIPIGTQFPWTKERQYLFWEDDDYDTLMRRFNQIEGAAA